jgi:ABC-type branched-subunit amino acid transport system substrate-binding protein
LRFRITVFLTAIGLAALMLPACQPTDNGDVPERAREHFERANAAYQDGDYEGALSGFGAVVQAYPETRIFPLALYRLAYSEFQLGRYREAAGHFARFLKDCPDHELEDDARLLYARALSEQGKYFEAAQSLGVLAADPDGRFFDVALESFEEHFAVLTTQEKRTLLEEFSTSYLGAYLFFTLGEEAYENGDLESAALYLRRLEEHPLETRYRAEGRVLLAEVLEALEKRPKVVGCLVPLSGDWQSYGNEVRTAVELAAARYNAGHPQPIEVVVADSRGTVEGARQALRSLAEESQAVAVIGPLSSTAFSGCLELAESYDLPLFTPAATDPGLAARSDYAFRNALTYLNQCETLAEFCSERLGLGRFGILYEDTAYGEGMRSTFVEVAPDYNIEIIVQESYPLEAKSYVEQCKAFRRQGLDAVFIPGHQPQLTELASQIVFLGIVAELVGGNGWNAESVTRMGMRYVEGAIFCDALYLRSRDTDVQSFIAGFRSRLGLDPGFLGAHAYDTFGILARVIAGGARTRTEVAAALHEVRDYPGIIGPTSIDADGEAHKPLTILTIVENEIVEFGTSFGY